MQLCSLSKQSDLTGNEFQGIAVVCLKCTFRQAVDSSKTNNPQTTPKYITHRVSLLLSFCWVVLCCLIIGYTLAVNQKHNATLSLAITNCVPCLLNSRQQCKHQLLPRLSQSGVGILKHWLQVKKAGQFYIIFFQKSWQIFSLNKSVLLQS